MKPTLLFATLSMVLASPSLLAKSELETLRALCKEQERQIHHLEDENAKLRSVEPEARQAQAKAEPAATVLDKAASVKSSEQAPASAPAPAAATYTVKAGDSFEKIARKVGSSPEKLAKTNGLKTTAVIRPGQKLKIPGAPAAAPQQAVAQAATSTPKSSAKTHKVLQGETFFSIAKKHGMSTSELIAANPKVKASAMRPGQVISLGGEAPASTTMISAPAAPTNVRSYPEKAPTPVAKSPAPVPNNIPVSTPTAPKPAAATAPNSAPAEPKAPEAKSAVAETPPAPAATENAVEKRVHPVTIDGEMTYGEFASKHGTDTERLNALNGLDLTHATVLAKGSELYVPAQP